MTESTDAAPRRTTAMPTWLIVTIAGVFGLVYAYAVWNAVAFLIDQANGALGLNRRDWAVRAARASSSPSSAFGVAFALGWRRRQGRSRSCCSRDSGSSRCSGSTSSRTPPSYGASLLG